MKNLRCLIVITLALWLTGQAGLASETRYITDSYEFDLRSGPSLQNRIVRMLRSGKPVELLETKDEWSRVKLSFRGEVIEGWLMSRYLISRQTWELQAKTLRQENDRLQIKLARLKKELTNTSSRGKEAAMGLKETTRALQQLEKKYEALKTGASEYLTLKKEYDKTIQSLADSQKKIQTLDRENSILQETQTNQWLGMGALILLFGLFIGLAVGKHQKKQKSTILYG